jgi:hypothetical protein
LLKFSSHCFSYPLFLAENEEPNKTHLLESGYLRTQ